MALANEEDMMLEMHGLETCYEYLELHMLGVELGGQSKLKRSTAAHVLTVVPLAWASAFNGRSSSTVDLP